MNYRPEIDSLRAVAVFAVIIYHAKIILFGSQILKGGFIGVDIFFVISGYLITSIILKEIKTNNNFLFTNFYERRARRLLPLLFFVIIISLPFSYFFLLPYSFIEYFKSIISSIFFFSNYYFYYSGNIYGAENSWLKPFLHTWSLSVEEQFYIFFPIFLLIICKFLKKKNYFFFFITLLSLFFSNYFSKNYTSLNFYFTLSRIFEFLMGSLAAFFQFNKILIKIKSYKFISNSLVVLGFLFIFYALIYFNDKMLLPSFESMIPVFGVFLIILFYNKNKIFAKIISNKFFVFLGIISYSLYLWHYPIFSFLRVIELFPDQNLFKIFLILLIIVISILSFYLIEKPFRNQNIISLKNLIIFFIFSIFIILLFGAYVLKEDKLRNRFPKIIQNKLQSNKFVYNKEGKLGNVALVGDSHALAIQFHLNNELKKISYNHYGFETPLYLNNFNLIDKKNKNIDPNFIKINSNIYNFLNNNKNFIVIIHSRFSMRLLETLFDNEEGGAEYFKNEDKFIGTHLQPIFINESTHEEREKYLVVGIISSIQSILDQGHRVILVYPVPEVGFNVSQKIINNNLKYLDKLKMQDDRILTFSTDYNVYKKRNKKIFEIFDSFKSDNLYRVFPHKHFCDSLIRNRCIANSRDKIFYYDSDHLSLDGSKFVVDDIIKIIKEIK
jgi:peptidoglycan/LPS O-acetylase OafA/YrhL